MLKIIRCSAEVSVVSSMVRHYLTSGGIRTPLGAKRYSSVRTLCESSSMDEMPTPKVNARDREGTTKREITAAIGKREGGKKRKSQGLLRNNFVCPKGKGSRFEFNGNST